MTGELATIAEAGQAGLLVGFIVFLRVGAATAVLPAFGEQTIPMRIRLVLALAFTMIVAPAVDASGMVSRLPILLPLLVTEPLVGLAIGLALRLMIMVLQMAGSMAAQSTSQSQLFGGAAGEPLPAFGHVLMIAGLAIHTAGPRPAQLVPGPAHNVFFPVVCQSIHLPIAGRVHVPEGPYNRIRVFLKNNPFDLNIRHMIGQ